MQETKVGIADCVQEYEKQNPGSRALYERALKSLPGGNTRSSIFFEPFPTYMARGTGCRIWDVDGNERIDFLNNYSSLIHGHCPPQVMAALTDQVAKGTAFASPTEAELRLAELIQERVPSLERLRFTSSGTEATLLALRAARAFTGRETIAKVEGGFHGSHEHVTISIAPSLEEAGDEDRPASVPDGAGIPSNVVENVVVVPFNNPAAVERILTPIANSVAAIIIEPVMGAAGIIPPAPGFLSFLREFTARHGMILIFDEIIAFRISYHGAQGYFGVIPDLTTLGKIIGGGLPVSAFGGRADVMAVFDSGPQNGVRHPGTFNGYPLAMASGIATLESLPPASFTQMEELTTHLATELRTLFARHDFPAQVTQIGSLFNIHACRNPISEFRATTRQDEQLKRSIHLSLLNHGFFLAPRGMGCLSTVIEPDEVSAFVEAMERVVRLLG